MSELRAWLEEKFSPVTWTGNGEGLIRCLYHKPDNHPSLSVNVDKEVFHCFTCGKSGTLRELAEYAMETYPRNGQASRETIYCYAEGGQVRFEKVRLDSDTGKTFFIRPKGAMPILYRLDELREALQEGKPAIWVEGEKDAETLRAAGFVATTTPYGAKGKLLPEFFEEFPEGSTVYLCGDADKPGQSYVERVGAALKARGCTVRVIELGYPIEDQHGKDVSNWLGNGHTAAEFAELLQAAKPFDTQGSYRLFDSLVSLRARQIADLPPRVWFIEGMVTPGFNMVAGKKAMGKSFLLVQMADAIAKGQEFLGRKTTAAKVLYVSFELDDRDTANRFKDLAPLSENAYILHTWSAGEKALADAEHAIDDYGFRVLMFDTFLPVLPQDREFKINDYGDSEFYLKWRMLGKKYGAAIVAAWHEGKNSRDDFMLDLIGTTGMGGQADTLVSIKRKRGDTAGQILVGGNHSADSAIPVIFENGVFTLGSGPLNPDRLTPDEERTMTVLQEHPEGCTPTVVGLAMGKSDNAARAALNRLIARGKACKITRGIYAAATLIQD